MLSISQASHIPTTISQAFFSTLGFDKSQIRFSNPKPSNPKLGICVWDMLADSNPKPRISQGGALGLGYAEHIPSLSNPNDDIPNLGFVLGICKSQNTKPNPKANRTQFGFWYYHEWCLSRSVALCRAPSRSSGSYVKLCRAHQALRGSIEHYWVVKGYPLVGMKQQTFGIGTPWTHVLGSQGW